MAFPNPSVSNRDAWIEQYFINQWDALEAIYDAIVAGGTTTGLATEATLAAFKAANHTDLDEINDSLALMLTDTDDIVSNTEGSNGVGVGENSNYIRRFLSYQYSNAFGSLHTFDTSNASYATVVTNLFNELSTIRANNAFFYVFSLNIIPDGALGFKGSLISAY